RHTRCLSDWSSDVCSSDLRQPMRAGGCSGRMQQLNTTPTNQEKTMNATSVTVQGVVKPDGTLEVAGPVSLPAGPVQVQVQPASQIGRASGRGRWWIRGGAG